MAKKIVNPETGKKIKVGGTVYLKLKRQGKLPKTRKGPTPSAKSYKIGKRKRGNDGRMWEVVKYAKGRRWQAVGLKKKGKKKSKKSPLHPFIEQNVNAEMMRTIDNLADYLSACKVNKLSAKFCRSIEGKEIRAKFENKQIAIADKLNKWSGENLSYTRWMQLENLDLFNRGIDIIPKELGLLNNLTILNLRNNQLKKLPNKLFDSLTNLRELYLSNNQLKEIPREALNPLTNLQTLLLNNNQLTSLPSGVFDSLTNLQVLSLSNNQLKEIPHRIFDSLVNLKSLSLSNNQLKEVPQGVFDSLTNLKSLLLPNNRLTSLPTNIFDPLTKIEYLDLYGNSLKEEDIPKLKIYINF